MEELLKIIQGLKFKPFEMLHNLMSDEAMQEWLLDVIREKQLFQEGIGEEGIIIGYYSPYTEQINPTKKSGTHFTLKDTGAFYGSMKVILLQDGFIIDADGYKVDEMGRETNLFEAYGKEQNLLGLTEKNMQEFIDKIKEHTINALRNG